MAEFLFAGPLWFIAPKSPYETLHELCAVVLRGIFEDDATGERVACVCVFSDLDLAERYLAAAGAAAANFSPLAMPDDRQLVALLETLQAHGDELLGIDATEAAANFLPVARAAEQIRRRQQAAPPDSLPPP